jgi:hypothetical protein
MEPGKELDVVVAEALGMPPDEWDPPCATYHSTDEAEKDSKFGWSGWCYTCGKSVANVTPEPPRYSTDIAAAFEVVEKMAATGRFHLDMLGFDGEEWRCWISRDDAGETAFIAEAATAPLVICIAALRALGVEP